MESIRLSVLCHYFQSFFESEIVLLTIIVKALGTPHIFELFLPTPTQSFFLQHHSWWSFHQHNRSVNFAREQVHVIFRRSSICCLSPVAITIPTVLARAAGPTSFKMETFDLLIKMLLFIFSTLPAASGYPISSGAHQLVSRGIVSPSNSELLHNTIAFVVPALFAFILRM